MLKFSIFQRTQTWRLRVEDKTAKKERIASVRLSPLGHVIRLSPLLGVSWSLSRAKVAKNVIDMQNVRTAHSIDPTARTLAANQTHSAETALRGGPKGVARGI